MATAPCFFIMNKTSAQQLVKMHKIPYRPPAKRDYPAQVAFGLMVAAMPFSLLCGLFVGLMPLNPIPALLREVFLFSVLGTWPFLLFKRRPHSLWPHSPLHAARHATRILFCGAMASLSSVLVAWAGRAAYTLFAPASPVMDALVAWSAVFFGQGLCGLLLMRTTRHRLYQYAGAAIYTLLFLGLFAL